MVERSANRNRRQITRLRYHANKAILRERACGPPAVAIVRPPLVNSRLVKMVCVQKCNKSIKVVQCPHGVMARLQLIAQQVPESPRHRAWATPELRFPKLPARRTTAA